MKKSGEKTAVKKTLVRNCELKTREPLHKVMYDLNLRETGSSGDFSNSSQKENVLSQPTLCSSESLANYLTEIKKTMPPPLSAEDINNDKKEISTKVTKKLNFHINDRMYKNLIELNASVEELKTKKDKKSTRLTKKDIEPNIEDFYENTIQPDTPPKVPVIRPKFKLINHVENGQLHKLVASFDIL